MRKFGWLLIIPMLAMPPAFSQEMYGGDNLSTDIVGQDSDLLPPSAVPFSSAAQPFNSQPGTIYVRDSAQPQIAGMDDTASAQSNQQAPNPFAGQASGQAPSQPLVTRKQRAATKAQQDAELQGRVSKSQNKGGGLGRAMGAIGKGIMGTAQAALPAAAVMGGMYMMSRAYSNSRPNYVYQSGGPVSGGYPVATGYPVAQPVVTPYGMTMGVPVAQPPVVVPGAVTVFPGGSFAGF